MVSVEVLCLKYILLNQRKMVYKPLEYSVDSSWDSRGPIFDIVLNVYEEAGGV